MNSPNSKGGVEGYIATLGGNVRALKMCVEERWTARVHNGSPIFLWMVRHSSWLHFRFQPQMTEGEEKLSTGFERLRGKPYQGKTFNFSEPMMIRLPFALDIPKMEPRWVPGLWLGKVEESDSHIVGTKDGIVVGRSVRPVAQDETVASVFAEMAWTPWKLSDTPTKIAGATKLAWCSQRGSKERAQDAVALRKVSTSPPFPSSAAADGPHLEKMDPDDEMEDDVQRGEKRREEKDLDEEKER